MTDKPFRKWVETLPSCLTGRYSEYHNGEGRNIARHVRRAKNSGIAIKPDYSCVPMTKEEHDTQHQHGEAACLMKYLGGEWTVQGAKDWFDAQAKHYHMMWLDGRCG